MIFYGYLMSSVLSYNQTCTDIPHHRIDRGSAPLYLPCCLWLPPIRLVPQ